jgi:hypothetical protein
MGDNDRSFSHRTIAKQSPRSRKALSMEIDSMLVYSQKDTIIQIAQIGEHGLSDITKIFKRGMYIDSLRHTFWRETDDEKNVIVQKDLLELWNGENWVPNYRYMERLTYDSGCVNSEARFEHFVNGTWSIEWTYTSSFLQLFDQYGNVISSIVCGYNPSTDGYIQFDTLYCRRSYSPDSVSCDIYADSTLTFMIPNIDHSISKKK